MNKEQFTYISKIVILDNGVTGKHAMQQIGMRE